MDEPRNDFFAGAGLAADYDRDVVLRDTLRLLEDLGKLGTRADDAISSGGDPGALFRGLAAFTVVAGSLRAGSAGSSRERAEDDVPALAFATETPGNMSVRRSIARTL
jgi:hypothetical protein